ncbi:MAG TPA: tyrosine-type recombinase/integrase [Gemmatimonadales bacterium]|nr:tyrosine-type recombinase/integrase [Gemmatimonadales bacterium]
MPHLPKNMVRRKGRPGYWFQQKIGGRRVRRFLGTDYNEAATRLKKLRGSEIPLSELRVGDALKRWIASYVATARNEKNQKLTERRAAKYLVPALGHYLLSRLTSEHLRSYRLHLEKLGLSAQSVSHLLADARCFLRWSEDAGLVQRSPFPRRLLPKLQERPPDRLTTEEAEKLRRLPEPYGFIFRLALGTGMRWAELTRAQASDVERGFLVVSQTKSSKVRRIPLDAELLAEIRTHVGRLVPFAEHAPGSFSRTVRKSTGLPRFHAHQLRHTFACEWLENGGSLAALQQVLGHASIVTTQRYARLTDEIVMAERVKMGERATRRTTSIS